MALEPETLRGMSPEELDKEEGELRDQIWKLRIQMAAGQLQNPHRIRAARRDLSRLLTIRRERQRAAAEGEGR